MTGNANGGASGGATAFIGLGIAAAALGAATAVGVFLFNKAFGLVHQGVFDGVGAAIAPLGAWTLVPLVAAGGIVVAVIVRFMRPEPLGAVPHIIDGVLEHDGRLNNPNAVVTVAGAAAGIGFGMPLGADTPSAMIGGHLGSVAATWLGWSSTFVRALVVAGVAAGISSTFLAQLAAVVFAFEVVLGGFGGIVFVVPTLIAVGVAGLVTYELSGTPATYPIVAAAVHWDASLLLYLAAAVVAGLAAIAYVGLLQRAKPMWSRVPLPPMGRMVLAGALVGLAAIWLPQIEGTGTATMKDLFGGATIPIGTLVALAVVELVLTPSSLGAGFVGGVIGPVDADRFDGRGGRRRRCQPALSGPRAVPGGVRDGRHSGDARGQLPCADLRGSHDLRDGRQLRDARPARARRGDWLRDRQAVPGGLGLYLGAPWPWDPPRAGNVWQEDRLVVAVAADLGLGATDVGGATTGHGRSMVHQSEREVTLVDRTLGRRRDMDKRLGAAGLALGLSLTLAACSGGTGSTAQTGAGTPTEAAGAPGPTEAGGGAGASAAAGGADGFEGSIASSGIYSANWTVNPETEPNPMNASNNPSLVSDKDTFGNIKVEIDGKVSFGSAASELSDVNYEGTGAKVTLDATGQFVCSFTIDNDLKGTNSGEVLHLSGGLTVHWHPEGSGDLNCP